MMTKTHVRALLRKPALPIAIASAAMIAIMLMVFLRWNAHIRNLSLIQSESAKAEHLSATYNRDLDEMYATGDAEDIKINSMWSAMKEIKNFDIAQIAVAKGCADSLLSDTSLDKLMAKIAEDVPPTDTAFQKDQTAMKEQEQIMHDGLTAFSTTISVVLNNPFMAASLDGQGGSELGHKIYNAESGLAQHWRALEENVSHLRDTARVRRDAIEHTLHEIKERNFFVAVLNP
jgi:hypothetical protein